ncbi:hypothetical protein CA983_05135 [Streptomyces swartbergensis]|uniref:Uncharacterized protein n=1 Tax=Streptomyces swartbergensis TaxID=487165 RepID=A0A243S9A6_9ACTN|nr:hypothetical protein CA983_05135 [Streptomyces swartbergensis]
MPNIGRSPRRSALQHLRTTAVLASAGMLVTIVLSALPEEPVPLPFSAGHHQDRYTGTAEDRLLHGESCALDEAEDGFGLVGDGRPTATRIRTGSWGHRAATAAS